MRYKKHSIFALGLIFILSGCAGKAKPGLMSGFIPETRLSIPEDLPFHHAWRKEGIDWDRYKKITIAPINTDYLLESTGWAKGERRGKIEKDAENLSVYTHKAFTEAFQKDPSKRFEVVEDPNSEDSLIVEIALTEVVPSKVTLNALGFAPYGVGTLVKILRFATDDRSTVAFESRVRDATTQEVLALFADREYEQSSLVSVRGLTWYGHAHHIIDDWAEQFVKIASKQPDEIIKDSRSFTLKPW